MKIIVDAFGGDRSPAAVIEGAALAVREYDDIEIVLTGNRETLFQEFKRQGVSSDRIDIQDASGVITVEEDPFEIRRSKKDSSMGVGLRLLVDGRGDAFVSAGSTGALAVGSSFVIRRLKGVRRAALAPTLPSAKGSFLLLDAGANLDCRPETLLQFAVMGSVYMRCMFDMQQPRVGLVNVGEEPTKGTEAHREAYRLLQDSPFLHFVGNIEARSLPLGVCDVAVADGLSGNMILKTMEGMGRFFVVMLKDLFLKNPKTKLAAGLLYRDLNRLWRQMDYTEYGGTIFLGASRPVVKAHGSSDANAFKNAIRQARACVDSNIIEEMKLGLNKISDREKDYERV